MTIRLLAGGVDAHGSPLEVRVDDATGIVVDAAPRLQGPTDEDVVDCTGLVLLTAAAEPHVHLDKVATVREAPNPTGELMDAVAAWLAYAPTIDFDDVVARATAAIDEYVAHGVTALRTNVNIHATIDPRVLDAILHVRTAVADRCEVQVTAMMMPTLTGDSELTVTNRRLAELACELGVDAMGAAPVTHPDPIAAIGYLAETAARYDLALDLHIDETLDPGSRALLAFADAVEGHGLGGRATAGHCVSLGMQPVGEQEETAVRLAGVGVAVVALPATNLWLQGRSEPVATPRGVTAVRRLINAGVLVATGADNIEDPFCPLGRADPFDAARLLALTAHLDPFEAWAAASTHARTSMGLPGAGPMVGARDIVAIEGRDLVEALAKASARRIVLRAGAIVAETAVTVTRGG